MLEVKDLRVAYGQVEAVHGVSFRVGAGEIVTLVGANGAGKTTTLRALSGMVRPTAGAIQLEGRPIHGLPAHRVAAAGLVHVPEGRMVFANLSVRENLAMGAYLRRDPAAIRADEERVFDLFPRLQERLAQASGTLSGGEQQMLAIGRGLMAAPRCLMLDEPSLGIAPILTRQIFAAIARINAEMKLPILLVEQNANLALAVSQHGCVLETGRIVLADTAERLRASPEVRAAYLGG